MFCSIHLVKAYSSFLLILCSNHIKQPLLCLSRKIKFASWELWPAPSHKLRGKNSKDKELKAVMQLGAVRMSIQAFIKLK